MKAMNRKMEAPTDASAGCLMHTTAMTMNNRLSWNGALENERWLSLCVRQNKQTGIPTTKEKRNV
jgi:hypothetical protein